MKQGYGLCQCGCGERTEIAKQNRAERGWRLGEPKRFVRGHQRRKSPIEYIADENGCWVWQRAITSQGYGHFYRDGKHHLAHRYYYEQANGPIESGMEMDHLCRNRACVNPSHLQSVRPAENMRRQPRVRLTEADAAEIRRRSEDGESRVDLAAVYGVTPQHIGSIANNQKWRP